MRLLQLESVVAGNPLKDSMSRYVILGRWFRDTSDDRIDSGKEFQSMLGDDSIIHRKEAGSGIPGTIVSIPGRSSSPCLLTIG